MNWQVDLLIDEIDGKDGRIGVITLQRATALNALNHDMILGLTQQLQAWATSSDIRAVVIQSSNPKAFCAGGDIRLVHEKRGDPSVDTRKFFGEEYQLNYLIATYPKPYIALIDGIDMGGGVGISLHGSFPIVTENARIAMPETTIGLFPDVGGCHLLSKLPHEFGLYFALTGNSLSAADSLYAGLVQYPISQAKIPDFLAALHRIPFAFDPFHEVKRLIEEFQSPPPAASRLQEHEGTIAECFAADSVEGILENLRMKGSAWCLETLDLLQQKSPTSLKVTFEYLRRAKSMSIRETLLMDFRLVSRFLQGHDFFEGIRALLIDKDKQPRWVPSNLREVSDESVQAYFAPLSRELELPL